MSGTWKLCFRVSKQENHGLNGDIEYENDRGMPPLKDSDRDELVLSVEESLIIMCVYYVRSRKMKLINKGKISSLHVAMYKTSCVV